MMEILFAGMAGLCVAILIALPWILAAMFPVRPADDTRKN